MKHNHTNTVAKAKRLTAAALLVALCLQDATPALAITFDSATSTYFDVIDDFGLAGGGTNIGLQFGGTLGEFLRFDQTLGKFVFTDDLDVQGTVSGTALTVMGGNSYVLGKLGIGTSTTPDTQLEVAGTISGAVVRAGSLSVSGSFTLEQNTTLSGSALRGFGLNIDCDTAGTSKLLWDATAGRFSCGTDTDTNTTYTTGQGLNLNGTSLSLAQSISGTLLEFQTTSGAVVYAERQLSTSGSTTLGEDANDNVVFNADVNSAITPNVNNSFDFGGSAARWATGWFNNANVSSNLSVLGTSNFYNNVGIGSSNTTTKAVLNVGGVMSGITVYATQSFSGAGLTTCSNATTSKLLWNATTGRFSCGTDQGATYTAGQGLGLNGTTLSLAPFHSGTTIWALNALRSSGALTWEGTGSGARLFVKNHLSVGGNASGALLTVGRVGSGTRLLTATNATLFSTDQMGLGQLEGGAFFGRTGLTQNHWLTGVGNAWTARDSARGWTDIAMSSDGKYMAASVNTGNLYVSWDYGATWTSRATNEAWEDIAMSSDGKHMTAVVNAGTIYTSSDYGTTWTSKASVSVWNNVAMSADGKYQAATSGNGRHISSDYGKTWTSVGPSILWTGVAMSSDGKIQAYTGNNDYVYVSTDYGVTIAARNSSRTWHDIVVSADGKVMTALADSAAVQVSRDYGATWSATDSSRAWRKVAMGADGRVQTATISSGQLYSSTDYGATWTTKESSRSWSAVAVNADGRIQAATVTSGQIYVSYGESYQFGNVAIGTGSVRGSAKLTVQGVFSGVTLYATRSFSGAGLSDCDTAGTSKLLWDATTGRFSCGTDQTGGSSGGTYFAGQGLSLNGANSFSLNPTVTGSTVHAINRLSSSGTTVLHGPEVSLRIMDTVDEAAVKPLIIAKSVSSNASTLYIDSTSGTDESTDGTEVGAYYGNAVFMNREAGGLLLGTNGTYQLGINSAGSVGIGGSYDHFSDPAVDAKLEVVGTVSGTSLFTSSFNQSTGLSDCDNATNSKLLWDATTGRFSCGTDQSGGAGGGLSFGTASGIFLKRSGGTMTGSIFLSSGSFIQTPGANPRTMSGIDLNANVNNVFVSGNYAYTVSDAVAGNEFRAIDIANPNAPVIVGGFDTGQNTEALFVSTRNAFIGMNGTGAGSGMYILDNSNPGAPVPVSRINFGSAVNSIYVSGKYAYVGLNARTTGVCAAQYQNLSGCDFALVDFSDVVRPRVIGGLQTGANVNQIYVQNRFAYLALDSVSGNDFRIVDITNPLSPITLGGLDVSNNVKSVYATGKYAFIGLSTDAGTEFRVVDITNKSSPTSITGIEFGTTVESVVVSGDWARLGLTSVTGNDYVTVDLRAPTAPSAIGGINYGTDVNAVAVGGKYAYVALNSVSGNDMRIVDLAGIESPAASIGTLAAGSLFASDNVRFDNNAYIRNALNVGRGGIISKGPLSVQATGTGSAKANTGTFLNAFEVRNGTGQHLFSVSENGTVQAGVPSFSTGTMMIALNIMSRRSGFCTPLITTATTYTSVGMSTCTVNGTAAAWAGGSRQKIKHAAANTANAMGGVTTTFTETKSTYRPKILFDVTTGTGTTGVRFYGGLVESSTAAQALTVASAASTIDYAAIAWEDGISGTQWLCCSGDGTNHSCQSMGVPVQTNTEYQGAVDWSLAGKVTCQLQVRDKTYRLTKTTNVSAASVALGTNVVIVNKSIGGATSKVMYNSRLVLEQN